MNVRLISDVRVGVLQEDGTGKQLSIEESPFYLALKNKSRAEFEIYRDVLQKVSGDPKHEMDFDQFMLMTADIAKNGFIPMRPRILFNEEYVAHDGHHRLAILYYLRGPNLGLEIENYEVINLWAKLKR